MATRRKTAPAAPAPAEQQACWRIPAVRGIQSGREYYTAMLRLGDVIKMIGVTRSEPNVAKPGDFKSLVQRSVNWRRVDALMKYILSGFEASQSKNRKVRVANGYVLSALTCVFDPGDELAFELLPDSEDLGILSLPRGSTKFHLADGQHRAAGIEKAVQFNPALADETVPVTLFLDVGQEFKQQVFLDLNQNVVKPNASLFTALDHRSLMSDMVRETVKTLAFKDRFAIEATSIPKSEPKLFFPLRGFEQACENLGLDPAEPNAYRATQNFWEAVYENMPLWQDAMGMDDCRDLRNNTLAFHVVTLKAMGMAGFELRCMYGSEHAEVNDSPAPGQNYLDALAGLQDIPWGWNRGAGDDDDIWEGIGVTLGGKLLVTQDTVKRIAGLIERHCIAYMEAQKPATGQKALPPAPEQAA